MKKYIPLLYLVLALSACGSKDVEFSSIKVFDGEYNIAIETSDEDKIQALKATFNNKVKYNGIAPNFKYLIEFQTSDNSERWRYSAEGYTQKYSQEDQTIFALLDSDEFNQLIHAE